MWYEIYFWRNKRIDLCREIIHLNDALAELRSQSRLQWFTVSSYIHVVWQSIKLPLLISYFCNLTQIWQWLFCGLKFVAGGGVQKGKRTVFLLIFNMILKNDTSKKWFFENLKVPCNCNYRTEKNGARGVGGFLILLF